MHIVQVALAQFRHVKAMKHSGQWSVVNLVLTGGRVHAVIEDFQPISRCNAYADSFSCQRNRSLLPSLSVQTFKLFSYLYLCNEA
jgi:hypothetical protein